MPSCIRLSRRDGSWPRRSGPWVRVAAVGGPTHLPVGGRREVTEVRVAVGTQVEAGEVLVVVAHGTAGPA